MGVVDVSVWMGGYALVGETHLILTAHYSYHHISKQIARPLQFEWRLRRYADSAQRLLPTDVDKLSEEEKVGFVDCGYVRLRFIYIP